VVEQFGPKNNSLVKAIGMAIEKILLLDSIELADEKIADPEEPSMTCCLNLECL
jgi:hypothetical protein